MCITVLIAVPIRQRSSRARETPKSGAQKKNPVMYQNKTHVFLPTPPQLINAPPVLGGVFALRVPDSVPKFTITQRSLGLWNVMTVVLGSGRKRGFHQQGGPKLGDNR